MVGLECEFFNFGKAPVGTPAAHQKMLRFFFTHFDIGTAEAKKPETTKAG